MDTDRRRPMRTLGRKAGTDSEQRRKEEVPKSVHLLQGPEVQSQRRLPADAERERHPARARHLPENQDTTTERRRRFRRGKIAAGKGSEHRGQPDPSVAKPPCAFQHDRHAKLSKKEDHAIYSTSRLACQEHFHGTLQLIPMTGDGNCLFHALAYRTRENAVHLQKDIIQFLRDAAQDQHDEEQEEAWLEEAAYLRGNANWGGDTAIVAFTLMRNQRVMLHWRGVDHRIHTDERTHRNVTMNLDAPDEDITHLWYNGEDHYDLLLPKPQSQAAAPAPDGPMGEGPPPPPPAPHAEPRPPKRNKTKAQRPAHQERQRSSARPEPATASWSAEPEEEETLLEELTHIQVASDAAHPRRKLEDALRHLAETHLREQPLVPPEAAIDNVGVGEAWPRAFCAFEHCTWSSARGTESDLHQHVQKEHAKELQLVARHMPKPLPQDALESIYKEAVARRCRQDAPVAGCSRDRTALRSFAEATSKDNVESLVCFSCACIYVRVADAERKGRIRWRSLLNPRNGEEHHEATVNLHQLLSRDKYFRRYDDLGGGVKLSEANDFEQWSAEIPGLGKLLCCPEDLRCPANPQHSKERVLCEHCEVPLCQDCEKHLVEGKLPPLSLCNDMWTGFAPERLHSEKITVMEMICASPCVTTLICMSMEARHRSEGTTLDEKAHCARHRLGARGNALTFPLPWEDVLRNLQAHDAQAEAARTQEGPGDEANEGPAQLPRAGQDLASTVRVLLKTNKTGKASDAEIKTLLHQATVRREVVVQLILDMKKSGHPSFQHCHERPVRRAAARLPQEGVPPEVLKVINGVNEEDETGHKLQPQKAATPSDGRETDIKRAGEVFANQRARGVVPEGCSQDREDQNAVAAAALNDLEDQLRATHEASCQTLEVRTGNVFVDQFQPLYFATAFCFCFKHGTACPDVQNTKTAAENRNAPPARRRAGNPTAFQVGIHDWAPAMQRRVETQFRRDWTFAFTLWNYIFRTMVNTQKNAFMYVVMDENNQRRRLTPQEILGGMKQIQRALRKGQYRDSNNEVKAVNGDLTKLRHVPGLSQSALKAGEKLRACKSHRFPDIHNARPCTSMLKSGARYSASGYMAA